MKTQKIEISYLEYEKEAELSTEDKALLEMARKAAEKAYAPYSGFNVGAAILLENDVIVTGNNQENAAYPSGLCAERVALFSASAQYPGVAIKALAITAKSALIAVDSPVFPCGACRQVMAEYESHQQTPVKIILSGLTGKIMLLNGVSSVLPFIFNGSSLTKKPV